MNKSFLNKRIPTLFGFLLILIGVSITTYLSQRTTVFRQNAAGDDTPQSVQITNVTDKSFTVTYSTNTKVVGSVATGIDKNTTQTNIDDRDQASGTSNPHNIHTITVNNLKASTQYFFSILSGQTQVLDNGQPFQIITAPTINPSTANPVVVKGKVLLPSGEPPDEAIVYVQSSDGQVLSFPTDTNGRFDILMNSMRTKNLNSWEILTAGSKTTLVAENIALTSRIVISSDLSATLPIITLSNDYDFTQNTSPIASPSADFNSFFTPLNPTTPSNQTTQILTPSSNQSFTDQQPLFKGVAKPNQTVHILIQSTQTISSQVQTDSAGFWQFRPTTPLEPGHHTITITALDQFGILKIIKQSFTVYAAGSQINQSATPSATPTVKVTVAQPTATPAVIPTPSATPTPTTMPIGYIPTPTKPPLPKTGNDSFFLLGLGGMGVAVVGLLFFIVTQGATPL